MKNNPYEELAKSLFNASASPVSKEHMETLVNSISTWSREGYSTTVVYPPRYTFNAPQAPAVPSISPSPSPSPSPEVPPIETSLESAYFQLSLDTTINELGTLRYDLRQRSNKMFNITLSFGVLGGFILLISIGFFFANIISVGAPGIIGTAISAYLTNVFYNLYKSIDNKLNNVMKDLRRNEETRIGLWLADKITNENDRDEAIMYLIKKVNSG